MSGADTGNAWDRYVGPEDRAIIARAQFGRRMGFGLRPALLAIDCQRYMVGERGIDDARYPSSCGAVGWAALDQVTRLARTARAAGAPVFFSRFTLDAAGADIGVYGRKRKLLQSQ